MDPSAQLGFEQVDDFLLALEVGHSQPGEQLQRLSPGRLGPIAELICAPVPSGAVHLQRYRDYIFRSAGSAREVVAGGHAHDFFHLGEQQLPSDAWELFGLEAQRAAQASGLAKRTAQGLVAAMREFEDNIRLHSKAVPTGFVAFRAGPGLFEFVVADLGIGVLRSLRQAESLHHLSNAGAALKMALSEGQSRYGPASNHGYGFRPLFRGLANQRGMLRFHSGDYCLEINGQSPNLVSARVHQRSFIPGFQISVVCQ